MTNYRRFKRIEDYRELNLNDAALAVANDSSDNIFTDGEGTFIVAEGQYLHHNNICFKTADIKDIEDYLLQFADEEDEE